MLWYIFGASILGIAVFSMSNRAHYWNEFRDGETVIIRFPSGSEIVDTIKMSSTMDMIYLPASHLHITRREYVLGIGNVVVDIYKQEDYND